MLDGHNGPCAADSGTVPLPTLVGRRRQGEQLSSALPSGRAVAGTGSTGVEVDT